MSKSQAEVSSPTAGLVPKGNNDKTKACGDRWGAYKIEASDDLRSEDYEVSHGGYDTRFVQTIPTVWCPSTPCASWKRARIGKPLHEEFLSNCGRSNPLSNNADWDGKWWRKSSATGVDAVILTFNLRPSTRSALRITTEIEKAGIPVRANHLRVPIAKRSAPTASF